MRDEIERYWREIALLVHAMPGAVVARVAEMLDDCRARGGTVFIAGNGGSAATASHFACDLVKGTHLSGRRPFRVVPLTDNMPLVTAWANDTSYERVFAEQLEPLVRPGDVLIAISASGNSPNVLAAARVARRAGAVTVALTGRTGGKLRRLADLAVCVPSETIEQVEDAHMIVAHSLCVALRQHLRVSAPARRVLTDPAPHPAVADLD
ncbi:sugar isomerase (SIS) [Sphaerobacter thermophilus DSM 20745]|uniref:Sugar isomerase (SIS) n=2 Tax=Sphaerobacter TaxID=2056 RepID=D1C5H2_SPHTD|nr:sugar isomerase (SIS) [Sphaerobacter thermophilus DSM 20745]